LIGWAVFGGLVLVGFFFGVVTGYEKPKPVQMAKANKESGPPPVTEAPKPASQPQPKAQPITTIPPKEEIKAPPADPPKANPPKADPPKVDKVDPPKRPTPIKKEEPKKQVLRPVSFQREVLPILRSHCLNCHGATGKPKGDVNLTSIANMMKSRGGKILVPGKPDESDVYTSITEREMPDGGRPTPTPKELMTLRNWILTGAKPRRRPHSRFARA
jgi:outer membrane biosynthesis protein TonB